MEPDRLPPPIEITPEYKRKVKRRSRLWFVGLSLLVLCGCGGAVGGAIMLLPSLLTARFPVKNVNCGKNMETVAQALLLYASDHDDRLPPAERWTAATIPVLKDPNSFKCSEVKKSSFAFALNDWLGGTEVSKVADKPKTVLLFEPMLPGMNATGDPRKDAAHPPRHNGKNNFAFLDGHVEALAQLPD